MFLFPFISASFCSLREPHVPNPVQPGVVVVKKGESLAAIASQFKIKVDDLIKLNPQFDPATKGTKVADLKAEHAKAVTHQGGRHAGALEVGEKIRVAPLADAYSVTAKGLTGRTDDPRLVTEENSRLSALRRLADRGGGANGAADGIVTEKEASDFIAGHEALAAKTNSEGPEWGMLDSHEQKSIISEATRNIVGGKVAADEGTKRLFNTAEQSFKTVEVPRTEYESPVSMLVGKGFVSNVIPVMSAGAKLGGPVNPIESLFLTDQSGSVAQKSFSPNHTFAKGEKGFDLETKKILPKGDYNKFQLTGKVHGWTALRGEVAVSRPGVSTDGKVVRTGSFTSAVGMQLEAVGEMNLVKGDVRTLLTGNVARQVQYQITTDPDRLKAIMTGKIAAPNPYTLENMKPGDTVTITEGPYGSTEEELRILKGKGLDRAGLDLKLDQTWSKGDRLVVRMLKDDASGNRHVMIFKGEGHLDTNVAGIGAIANPKIDAKQSPRADKLSGGAFVRLMAQAKEIRIDNTFKFVEVNVDDQRTGGGYSAFKNIMATGGIPAGQTAQPLQGVIAHGNLDYDETQRHTALQLTGYTEANWNFLGGLKGSQTLGQGSIDLFSNIHSSRDLVVRYVNPQLAVKDAATPHDDAMNSEVRYGPGTRKMTEIYSDGGNTRYINETQQNSGTGQSTQDVYLTGFGALKVNVIDAFKGDVADQKAGKVPLFKSFAVNTPDGKKLTGQDAVNYLESHTDKTDDHWYSSGVDRVNMRIFTGDAASRTTFAENISKDSQAFYEANKNFYILTAQDQASQHIFGRLFGGSGGAPSNLINMASHNSKDVEQQLRTMSGEDLGAMIFDLQRFRKAGGENRTHPIYVEIDVKY